MSILKGFCVIYVILFHVNIFLFLPRITAIDIKYKIWKFGVVFTDNVSHKRTELCFSPVYCAAAVY